MRTSYTAYDDSAKPILSAFSNFGGEIPALVAAVCLDMEATKIAALTGLNQD